jgi:hypothetical protein
MRFRTAALLGAVMFASSSVVISTQGKPAPITKKPAAKSAPAAKKTPVAPPSAVDVPPPPPPMDVQFTTKDTTGDQVTESTSYVRGARERYDVGDMTLLKQHDQKRTVEISRASNTYLVSQEGVVVAAPAPRPSGVWR